jgi:type III restriction enzyme
VATAIERHVPEAGRAHFAATVAAHRAKVEVEKSPAEKGAAIEVPFLFVEFEGDAFLADGEKILERVDWSLLNHPAEIGEAEMDFRRSEQFIEIDIDGEKLVFSQGSERVQPGLGLIDPSDTNLEATLVQWLERHCRAQWLPPDELSAWLAKLIAWMTTVRGVQVRTLIDWQYPLATKIRAKIDAIRRSVRVQAHQRALFDDLAVVRADLSAVARFDAESYSTVPTQSTGAFRLKKHLLGPSRVALLDGDLGGEEFQCAYTLDNLDEVELWVRNLPRHPASFWLPKAEGRFYPDFVARLTDGRLFIVEYKGAHLIGAPDEREKTLLGTLWARKTGNVFATVQKMLHGVDVEGQLRNAIAAASR